MKRRFHTLSLKNKIYLSTIAVILFISVAIAFLSRWILISSLTTELEHRGVAIAHSIADQGRGFILEKDTPSLVSLVFDTALLGERKALIAYIFIGDIENSILAHTFTRPFPDDLRQANPVLPQATQSIQLVEVNGKQALDIAVPVTEGIYRIATVHVGLNKEHIDQLIGKLRITFLGFISAIIIIIFLISHTLSTYITKPISKLTAISDEVSRGNFDVEMNPGQSLMEWDPQDCPAYQKTKLPCWHFDQSAGADGTTSTSPENLRTCKECLFYKNQRGDELVHLADSFNKMLWSIKLYRRKLRESEEKYRSLFDSGPDPVLVVDSKRHRILAANPRAEELYGYSKSELLDMHFPELWPDYEEVIISRLEGLDATGASSIYMPKSLHYKKGKIPFYVNAHACPISYKGKQALIIAANDITEMIEKDAQLIQASKMKTLGEMSAGIAHELNQPLNAIKMGSDFLTLVNSENKKVSPEDLNQVATEISAQVDRATEIINTLRAFGRKTDFVKERLDVNKSVRGVMNIIEQQLKLQNITVELDLAQDVPPIMAHDNRLQQILFNLVTNARDAILMKKEDSEPAGRRVTIRSYSRNGVVAVEVGDTGIGIPKASMDKIFEPFFTTKETGQGMGLGLSITYGIVKDYGGDIHIQSKEGVGTTFTITFPIATH